MRLIDADKLKHEAEHCIETTETFQELIDNQPLAFDVDGFIADIKRKIRNTRDDNKIVVLEDVLSIIEYRRELYGTE